MTQFTGKLGWLSKCEHFSCYIMADITTSVFVTNCLLQQDNREQKQNMLAKQTILI